MTEQQSNILYLVALTLLNSGLITTAIVAARHLVADRLGPQRAGLAMQLAHQAVTAVEQLATAAGWDNPTKRAEALARAIALAETHGIALSTGQWSTLLESAVHELNTAWTELPAPLMPPAAMPAPAGTFTPFVAGIPGSSIAPVVSRGLTST